MEVLHCILFPESPEIVMEVLAEVLDLVHGLVGEGSRAGVEEDLFQVLVDLQHGLAQVEVPILRGDPLHLLAEKKPGVVTVSPK